MTHEEEFLALMDHRERINARIDDLVAIIAPARSGLYQSGARPGLVLHKGGCPDA